MVVFKDNSADILRALSVQEDIALEMVGEFAEQEIVDYMTTEDIVDTGRLRGSIKHAKTAPNEMTVGTDVKPYAIYVHEGARGRGGRPYIRKPILDNQLNIKKIIEGALKG